MAQTTLTQLKLFAKVGAREMILRDLARPGAVSWPGDPHRLLAARDDLVASLGASHKDFIHLSILSSCLFLAGKRFQDSLPTHSETSVASPTEKTLTTCSQQPLAAHQIRSSRGIEGQPSPQDSSLDDSQRTDPALQPFPPFDTSGRTASDRESWGSHSQKSLTLRTHGSSTPHTHQPPATCTQKPLTTCTQKPLAAFTQKSLTTCIQQPLAACAQEPLATHQIRSSRGIEGQPSTQDSSLDDSQKADRALQPFPPFDTSGRTEVWSVFDPPISLKRRLLLLGHAPTPKRSSLRSGQTVPDLETGFESILDRDASWWRNHFITPALEAGMALREWMGLRWVSVPVAAHVPGSSSDENSRIVYFLVGSGTMKGEGLHCPPWAERLLSPEARGALEDAFLAACSMCPGLTSAVVYPLLPWDYGTLQGRSLGLPLALAMLSAGTGQNLSSIAAATGDIHPDGSVGRVGDVDGAVAAKAEGIKKTGCRLLILPRENLASPLPEEVNIKRVGSLRQAWFWSRLSNPSNCDLLNHLELAFSSGENFVNNCCSIPPDLLKKAAQEETFEASRVIRTITEDTHLAGQLIRKLESCLHGESADLERASVLASLISPESLERAGFTPLNAFSWCLLNIALSNHRGDTAAREWWSDLATRYEDPARKADGARFAQFVNHHLVGTRHNTYTFLPDLPRRFLEILHRQEAIQAAHGGSDQLLGSFYGTVAQNFAFCGPSRLQETREFVRKAQDAFGMGEVPDYKQDYLRQLNYLCYALLDAGRFDEAHRVLLEYLPLSPVGSGLPPLAAAGDRDEAIVRYLAASIEAQGAGSFSRDNSFQLAAAARFLADSVEAGPKEIPACGLIVRLLEGLARNPCHLHLEAHPWQLFNLNMGRVAHAVGETHRAIVLWKAAAELCLKLGETVRAMALLPAAHLFSVGALPEEVRQRIEAAIESIRQSRYLCRDHFRGLHSLEATEDILIFVKEHAPILFPFTYR